MDPTIRSTEKRLAQLKREVPTRGFERHPAFIKSLGELPPELCSPLLQQSAPWQTMIAFPPQIQRGHHYVPRQALLFKEDEVTHVQASIWPGEPPQLTRLGSPDILYTKVTLLLLYGFLEVVGQGADAPVRLAVEFNTVAWDKLASPVRRLVERSRRLAIPSPDPQPVAEDLRSRREALPLKFINGIRIHGLLEGETLQDFVFQPGLTERRLILFQRAILPNTLVLLTAHFVVVIQEELKVAQGWIVTYLPREKIVSILDRPEGRWDELTFQLQGGAQAVVYPLHLETAAAQAWRSIWTRTEGRCLDAPNPPAN